VVAWLVLDGQVLASLERADTMGQRLRGLLGRHHIEGALLLTPCRSVHTVGMAMPIDVAMCDADLTVLRVATVAPNRVCLPRRRARCAVEAPAGALARWGVVPGTVLEVRGD
jgi:uncharacterized membrane protein (UPF0127 family)